MPLVPRLSPLSLGTYFVSVWQGVIIHRKGIYLLYYKEMGVCIFVVLIIIKNKIS